MIGALIRRLTPVTPLTSTEAFAVTRSQAGSWIGSVGMGLSGFQQSLHTSSHSLERAEGNIPAAASKEAPTQPSSAEEEFTQSPLLMQPSTSGTEVAPVTVLRNKWGHPLRTWQWYDEDDERKQQKEERTAMWPNAGHSFYQNVPQSIKKMNRILKLVRGLQYDEAVYQCKATPHKAARFTLEALETAREDAIAKGLDPQKLVVALIWANKGLTEKKYQHFGKGGMGKDYTHKSHVRVVLREDPNYQGFRMRLVSTIMDWKPRRTNFATKTVV